MRVNEIMRTRVETISPRESAATALERMRRGRIRHLVVEEAGRIVGVVSDRDAAAAGAPRQAGTVDDVMSRSVVTCSADTTVRQAANLLRGRAIGCLPVVEAGKPVGIVTITDLLELIGTGSERPVPKTRRWVLKDRGPGHKRVAGRGRTQRSPAPR